MSDVFDEGLQDLAARAATVHGQGGGFAIESLVSRVRRRRRLRGAVLVVVSAAAVAVVGVSGATLTDRRPEPPLPAQTSTPHPTPRPTTTPTASPPATPEPVALPAGDPSLPFGDCGSLVRSAPQDPATDLLELTLSLDSSSVVAGGRLVVDAATNTSVDRSDWGGFGVGALPASGPRFLVVRDGVVVGIDDAYHGARTDHRWYSADANGLQYRHLVAVGLVVCDPAEPLRDLDAASVPLPAGAYELYALEPVVGAGSDTSGQGDVEALATTSSLRATVVSSAVAFTVTGAATVPLPAPEDLAVDLSEVGAASSSFRSCWNGLADSLAPPELLGESGVFDVTIDPLPSRLDRSTPWELSGALTYNGPGRYVVGTTEGPFLELVQGGVVVAQLGNLADTGSIDADMGTGTTLKMHYSGSLLPCQVEDANGVLHDAPLEPGVYTAYLMIATGGLVRTGDSEVSLEDAPTMWRGPFTIQLD